ncbi:succinate dehydrogenase, cytochrome b556 subunit [Methyloglobulus morosus KoM1]|jgi:succinate dehydrogenase / fumarate reductase, cytochrome b subunit|uniref:Succinate dehydrogenase cytochrome b556 subunit n=1 Tax=Methyloglobulus morosus KoM1 TaxID=1116472 RepID=V5BIM3_9GAMM|nr:succinate dehydrogenase, cytochrome b556 subunit [Methyloglobulus morosus]ESS73145.1 succinate dehydrogenase, cytochrome b556 subunit [Methyloglobulus morosus KoM1]
MTAKNSRPTSPHLQVYKLPLTGLISISHRITGVLLSAGLLLVVALFYALSQGADSYAAMQSLANFWLIKLVYWGFIYALFFHLCHGLRHLVWDVGEGFEPDKLNQYAKLELAAAFALTLATWIFI